MTYLPKEKREERRVEKLQYLERKKKLFELEEKNYNRIILMRGTRGFWVFGGHSAVLLAYKLAPELKIRVGIKRDTDFDYKFHEGIVAISNVEFYVDTLKKSMFVKSSRKTKDAYYFTLKEQISEAEYKLLSRSPELKRQKLANMIIKSHPMPQVNMKVEDVLRTSARLYKKYPDPVARELLTRRLFEQVRMAHKIILMIAREEMDKKSGLNKSREILSRVMCDIAQVAALEYWSVGDCTAISAQIINALNAIDVEKKMFVDKQVEVKS